MSRLPTMVPRKPQAAGGVGWLVGSESVEAFDVVLDSLKCCPLEAPPALKAVAWHANAAHETGPHTTRAATHWRSRPGTRPWRCRQIRAR